MFTPALTGCVLEIDGNTITHHDGKAPRRDEVAQALTRGGRTGHRHWTNGDYYASVVIGARLSGKWRFFQQSLQAAGDVAPLGVDRSSEI